MSLGLLTSSLRVLKNLKEVQYDRVLGQISARLVDKDGDFSHIARRKTRLQLVLLSCAVCGIEFCYAAETAFVSPTLLKIGVPVVYMTLIWCLSPFLGLFLVPLFGSLSDRCRSPMGRRRPFILALSVGIVIGLLFVPNGKKIGQLLGDRYSEPLVEWPPAGRNDSTTTAPITHDPRLAVADDVTEGSRAPANGSAGGGAGRSHPWSVLFTVIGVVLLDFSCDSCQSPCRAYLVDVCLPEDHSAGLSTFTIMAGLGGSLGYVMGGVDWRSTALGTGLPSDHVTVVFSLVLVIYLVCLTLTIGAVKEVPLDKLGVTAASLQRPKKKIGGRKYRKFVDELDQSGDSDGGRDDELCNEALTHTKASYGSRDQTSIGNGVTCSIEPMDSVGRTITDKKTTTLLGDGPDDVELYQLHDGNLPKKPDENAERSEVKALSVPLQSEVTLKTYLMSIVRMPKSLAILCLTNLFCWMSLVCYSLYFTDFVGQAVYGGDPMAEPESTKHALYEQGVRTGSLAMSLYSLSCAVYSMSIEKLVSRFRARPVYIFSQIVYTIGAALMAITRNKVAVILLSPCAGVMYATLFTMPYLLVAHYHSSQTFEATVEIEEKSANKPIRGLGTDIALVSSMVFFAQFLLSACMGAIVHSTGTTASVMAAAAVLSFCGSLCATRVLYLDL